MHGDFSTVLASSVVWAEASSIPDVMADLLDDTPGVEQVARVLAGGSRIVATGNGAAYYAAQAMALEAWASPSSVTDVVAVPAGLISSGSWQWREGDVPLVFSSSGELRDIAALVPAGMPPTWVLSTSTPGSSLHRAASASVVVPIRGQRAVTHTQAFAGNVLVGLMLWRAVCGVDPRDGLSELPHAVADALDGAPQWSQMVSSVLPAVPHAAMAFGTGGASVAALETALLLKEVAGIPAEGLETREGATSGMYALRPGHLVLAHPTLDDPLCDEAADVCARMGADVIRVPGGVLAPRAAAALTTFPAALALAGTLGRRAGLDIDQPTWTSAYYATARINPEEQS
jgi:glucosamine 6-phosphate synthetase-like amidotransferase/phosphosugar isomerase protein